MFINTTFHKLGQSKFQSQVRLSSPLMLPLPGATVCAGVKQEQTLHRFVFVCFCPAATFLPCECGIIASNWNLETMQTLMLPLSGALYVCTGENKKQALHQFVCCRTHRVPTLQWLFLLLLLLLLQSLSRSSLKHQYFHDSSIAINISYICLLYTSDAADE